MTHRNLWILPVAILVGMALFFLFVARVPGGGHVDLRSSPALLVLAVLALTVTVVLRRRFFPKAEAALTGSDFLPAAAPRRDGVSRVADGAIVLCLAAVIWVMIATNPNTNGLLLGLDAIHPGLAAVHKMLAIVFGLVVLASVGIVAAYEAPPGVILATGMLCIYGFVLNGNKDVIERLALESGKPRTVYTIDTQPAYPGGVELWVNDVYLGQTPVTMDMDDFLGGVPHWKEKPPVGELDPPWIEFRVPVFVRKWGRGASAELDRTRRTYVARMRFAGEWGTGHYAGGGSGGGRYGYEANSTLSSVRFQAVETAKDKLLDKARLGGYVVDEEWYRAMASYGEIGLHTLLKAMEKEPRFAHIADGWARWKYTLGDPESRAAAFMRISEDVKKSGEYDCKSITGRAVASCAPHLDPRWLAEYAEKAIRASGGYLNWRPGERHGFQCDNRTVDRLIVRGGYGSYALSALALHATVVLDQALDAKRAGDEGVLERRVSSALVRWHNRQDSMLRQAAKIGGKEVATYVFRRYMRSRYGDRSNWEDFDDSRGQVNRWLYLMASLRTPEGDTFRREHGRDILEMAEKIVSKGNVHFANDIHELSFLFLDLDRGSQSLAMQFWNTFRERVRTKRELDNDALELLWRYLVEMEALPTVQMYVDCWRAMPKRAGMTLALDALEPLPWAKKEAVLESILKEVNVELANRERRRGDPMVYWPERLEARLRNTPKQDKAKFWMRDLRRRGDEPRVRKDAMAWLEKQGPDHPLMDLLMKADRPELRALAIEALKRFPTPTNVWRIELLYRDTDPGVSDAARMALEELRALEEMPPHKLSLTSLKAAGTDR